MDYIVHLSVPQKTIALIRNCWAQTQYICKAFAKNATYPCAKCGTLSGHDETFRKKYRYRCAQLFLVLLRMLHEDNILRYTMHPPLTTVKCKIKITLSSIRIEGVCVCVCWWVRGKEGVGAGGGVASTSIYLQVNCLNIRICIVPLMRHKDTN